MLCKSSTFDLEPRKASEEVDTSSSPQSISVAVGDSVVLVTLEVNGEGVDFGRLKPTVACGTWLSSPVGET